MNPFSEIVDDIVLDFYVLRLSEMAGAFYILYTQLKKYNVTFTDTVRENKKLKKSNAQLNQSLADATKQSSLKKLEDAKLRRDYEAAVTLLDRIPPEIVNAYARMPAGRRGKANEEVL